MCADLVQWDAVGDDGVGGGGLEGCAAAVRRVGGWGGGVVGCSACTQGWRVVCSLTGDGYEHMSTSYKT